MPEIYFSDAIRQALDQEMERDAAVFLMGEDIGAYGGAFGITRGLIEKYGPDRVRETPISENGFAGVAVGAAMTGLRPVVEIMFMDFILLAADQIINHAAKLHYIYDGRVNVPLVIRAPAGAGRGYGASHSQNLESLFMSVAGLKIVVPATPADAKGLLISAIRDPNPVLFIEPKALYGVKGEVPAECYATPLGVARTAREGGDLTLIAYGAGVPLALQAARELAEGGLETEVLDLRTLKPMDRAAVASAARKTGRCIVIEEGPRTCGIGAEVAAVIGEEAFGALKAPVQRVAAKDAPIPSAPTLERAVMPSVAEVLAAADRLF
jgi:pyruvate dehydrogenase E1 component beta subunit